MGAPDEPEEAGLLAAAGAACGNSFLVVTLFRFNKNALKLVLAPEAGFFNRIGQNDPYPYCENPPFGEITIGVVAI
jgi:hypothetical protein